MPPDPARVPSPRDPDRGRERRSGRGSARGGILRRRRGLAADHAVAELLHGGEQHLDAARTARRGSGRSFGSAALAVGSARVLSVRLRGIRIVGQFGTDEALPFFLEALGVRVEGIGTRPVLV